MSSPSVALGGAIFPALKAHAGLTALVSTRVYDRVPKDAVFPYVTVRVTDSAEDDDGCGKHWICGVQVSGWSREPQTLEARQIAAQIRAALDTVAAVTGFGLSYQQFRLERIVDDPDGITTQAIITYEFGLAEV